EASAWYSGAAAAQHRAAADAVPKAEAAAHRAIELDPNLADGYASLGRLQVRSGHPLPGDASYTKALSLDPNNSDAMWLFANLLAEVGRLKESLATMQRLLAIEPLVPVYNINAAEVMWENGKDEDAIAMMASAPPFPARVVDLAEIYASMGRYTLAADQLMNTPAATFFPGILKEADRLLRAAPASTNPSPAVPLLARF